MKRRPRLKALVLAALGLVLAACASTPVLRKPIERERVYASPVDKVWEATVMTLARGGGIINTLDKSSGLIAYTRHLNSDDVRNFAVSGDLSGPFGSGRLSQGSGLINILIRPSEDGKTRVYINGRIQIRSTVFSARGDPAQLVHLANSNGKMEEEFLDQIAMELGEKEFPWLKKEDKAPDQKQEKK